MNFKTILSYSLRIVNKNRAYSAINLLGLSLGLTVFSLIILFVQYEFGYDRHQANYDKIYRIVRDGEGEYLGSTKFVVAAAPIADALREKVSGAEFVTRIKWQSNVLINAGETSFLEKDYHAVDPDFFKIFSYDVIAGSYDGLLSDPTNVVITESVARKYFNSAEEAVGKLITAEGLGEYVVQSVVRDFPFQSHFRPQILLPFQQVVEIVRPRDLVQWDSNNYYIYFTLQPGTDITAAEKQLNDYVTPKLDYKPSPICMFQSMADVHLGEQMNFDIGATGSKDQLYIFLCIGLLVLIIACINYINMATARSTDRAKEIGIRKVNGALRFDLIVQFMFEAFLSTTVAAVIALIAIVQLLPAYNEFLEKQMSIDYLLRAGSILFAVTLIATVAIIAGAYPAFLFSSFKPIQTLKGKLKQSRNSKLRNVLVVFQFVVSGVLVFSTLIVWKQMEFVKQKDLGFNRDHIVIVRMRDQALGKRHAEIREMLLKDPAIKDVSGSMMLPTGIRSHQGRVWKARKGEQHISIYINQADPNFINLYEIPLLAGRNLSAQSQPQDAVVNETMVRELGYTNEEIVGRQFNAQYDTTRIIGVIGDFHYQDFSLRIEPLEIKGFNWGPPSYLSVKVQGSNVPAVIDNIKKTLAAISEKYPFEYTYYDEVYLKTFIAEAKTSKLMTIFSSVAIIIAALGLYGLILHMVNQRMKEIGIRKTLGAGSWSIVRLLSGKFGVLILTGYVIASAIGYYGVNQWLEGFAYKVSPGGFDFAITLLSIVFVAALAVYSRIAVALRVNPASVLKQTD